MTPRIDHERIVRELEELAAMSDEPPPAVTRIVFSDADLRARSYVTQLCRDAGLAVRHDAVGNTFALWHGTASGVGAVATGSHIDAIPHSGRYDGTVGVLGGLEAIRALMRAGFEPRHPIELVVFTSEEPTRFGIGCLGSRVMTEALDAGAGDRLRDSTGATLNEVRARAGFTGPCSSARIADGAYSAFVELHIEQGPILERNGTEIGVVTAIAAPASLRVSIEGTGGHAGAVLMKDRHDALLAAAEIALAVEAAARASGSDDTVGTVGVCDVFPGAVNSIPSRARIEMDVRDVDGGCRDAVLDRIAGACDEIARRRGVAVEIERINADPPARCAPVVVDALVRACQRRGLRHERMVSRAYHDALFMSRVASTGMLFIPCRNGVSHRPDEYASPEAIGHGAAVLADTLADLSARAE